MPAPYLAWLRSPPTTGCSPTASTCPTTTRSGAPILHNPASNLNNGVGYADPRRFADPVALGTDGIGADMLDMFRLAYLLHRSVDVTATPGAAWAWLEAGWGIVPEAGDDRVTWSYDPIDPWHVAFTPGVRPLRVEIDGEVVLDDGVATRVDPAEVRAKAAEQAGPAPRPVVTDSAVPRGRWPGQGRRAGS